MEKAESSLKQDVGYIAQAFETTTTSITAAIKNKVAELNDIVINKTKEKSANLERIEKLNASFAADLKSLNDLNLSIDKEVQRAKDLITNLTSAISTTV